MSAAVTRALVVGGLDPSCGAGVVLDAFVFASLGVAPVTVAATVTAQGSATFLASRPVDSVLFRQQLDAVAEAPFSCVKTGAMGSAQNLRELTGFLLALRRVGFAPPTVVDPVLTSSSGGELFPADDNGVYDELCRIASVVTPNAEEAARLSGVPANGLAGAAAAARALACRWGCVVVVTGVRSGDGRRELSEVVDVLCDGERVEELGHPFVSGADGVRGTGCVFASAVAASLAGGDGLAAAVRAAQRAVASVVANARGHGAGRPQADLAALVAAGGMLREG